MNLPTLTLWWLSTAVDPNAIPHRFDAPIPPRPASPVRPPSTATARRVGRGTTVFVNFDGIDLGQCNPSNSKADCHWYNNDRPIPAFSGPLQMRISVLQAMRRDVADYGIRIVGDRPSPDESYTMVVYGGTEDEFGALGSAPSGDCLDQIPNQIAFAHLDGILVDWINGGATTALHEAAHSWGLDHIATERSIMFPSGNNEPTAFRSECSTIVSDVALTPGTGSCPELNQELCGRDDEQDANRVLRHLFGPAYVDTQMPQLRLLEPSDGQYFQAPANFDVVLEIQDDLHPQVYQAAFWLNDDPKPELRPFIEDHVSINALPVGTWAFHVEFADRAGNTSRLDFEVDVGDDPPPAPEASGCGCTVSRPRDRHPPRHRWPALLGLVPLVVARRRSPR